MGQYVPVMNIFLKAAKNAILHQTAHNLAAAHTLNIHMTSASKLLCPMMNKKLQGVSFQGKKLYTGLVHAYTVCHICMYVYKSCTSLKCLNFTGKLTP